MNMFEHRRELYLGFRSFMLSTPARKRYLREIQISMFNDVSKRLERDVDELAQHMMQGRVSHFIETLALEEMLSSNNGKAKAFVNRFVGDEDVETEKYVESMRHSSVEILYILEVDRDENIVLGGLDEGTEVITKGVKFKSLSADIMEPDQYWLVRLHRVGKEIYDTEVALGMAAAEVEVEEECRDCANCREFRQINHELTRKIMVLISKGLSVGIASESIEAMKKELYSSPLEKTIMSLKASCGDPRKVLRVVKWIEETEKEMKSDSEYRNISTDWIWEDLGIEGLRSEARH